MISFTLKDIMEEVNKVIQKLHDKLKILIVDDAEYNRKTMSEILTNEGFNVVGLASSAEDAIKVSLVSKANLIFIDIVMPEISGMELLKYFQDKHPYAKYFIMMSSLHLESIVIESISNGATDFLQKPFGKNDLIYTVEKVAKIVEKENH